MPENLRCHIQPVYGSFPSELLGLNIDDRYIPALGRVASHILIVRRHITVLMSFREAVSTISTAPPCLAQDLLSSKLKSRNSTGALAIATGGPGSRMAT